MEKIKNEPNKIVLKHILENESKPNGKDENKQIKLKKEKSKSENITGIIDLLNGLNYII
jgi:hypothetical protein